MQAVIRIEGLKNAIKDLNPRIYQSALAATVNDLSGAVKTEVAQKIKTRYTIQSSRVKAGIKLKARAIRSRPQAVVEFMRKPPGLQHYKAIQITTAGVRYSVKGKGKEIAKRQMKRGKPTQGVSVEVIRGRRKIVQRAFLAQMRRGGIGIWKIKKGTKRKLERLYGPSVGGIFRAIGGKEIARKIINERIQRVFSRQIERYRHGIG